MKRTKKRAPKIIQTDAPSLSDTRTVAADVKTAWKRTLVVFLAALAVRLLYLVESSDSPFFQTLISDSTTYHFLAKDLLAHKLGWKFFYQGVFYPSFLSSIYFIFGPSIIAVKVIQAFLGAACAALTERLGTRIGGSTVGLIGGGIVAFYAPLVFFDAELLATSFATFFAVALLYGFATLSETSGRLHLFLLGVAGGLSVLTHPVFLPFFALAFIAAVFSFRRASRAFRIRCISAVLLGFFLVILPVAGVNKRVTNHFTFLPSSGGLNLYLGNNPDICSTLTIRPGAKWEALVNEPLKHGFIYGADKETFYTNKFIDYIRNEPFHFLAGMVAKSLRFINGREIPRNQDLYLFHQWSTLMKVGVWKFGRFGFPFALVFAFAVVGIVFAGKIKPPIPIYLFTAIYPLSVILVFVAERYRLPLIPILSIFAAIGIVRLKDALRSRWYLKTATQLAVWIVALLASVTPPAFCEEKVDLEAEMYFQGGIFHIQENRIDRGIEFFQKATTLNPGYYEAFKMLGLAENQKGKTHEAIDALQKACALNLDDLDSRLLLGRLLAESGRYSEAVDLLDAACKRHPEDGRIHSYLGICLANSKRLEEARDHLKTASELMPQDPLPRRNLENVERRLSSMSSEN